MKSGDLVKVVRGNVRRGEVGRLVEQEYVWALEMTMWKVTFDSGQTGLYESNELRKV